MDKILNFFKNINEIQSENQDFIGLTSLGIKSQKVATKETAPQKSNVDFQKDYWSL